MASPFPGSKRRCSTRLSLSRNYAGLASRASSTCSAKIKTPVSQLSPLISEVDNKEIIQILADDPFRLTNLTLAEEDDLISLAADAVTLSSEASALGADKTLVKPMSVVSISSGSDHNMTTPRKSTIAEFFTPLKARRDSTTSGMVTGTSKTTARKSTSRTERSIKTDPKKVKKVRRQICKSTNIKTLSNKYFDESQKRITNFFIKTEENPDRVGYHRVFKSSAMPTINTGDENIERFLDVKLEAGVAPLQPNQIAGPSMSQVADDPTKIIERIEKIQSANHDQQKEDWNMEEMQLAVVVVPADAIDSGYSNDGPSSTDCNAATKLKKCNYITPASKKKKTTVLKCSTAKKAPAAKTPATMKRKERKIICPKYKIIAGTTFAVDAFRYGDIEGVSHYFLTHFHADHYIGLKRSFDKPLIMSPITARLVKAFINVGEDFYRLVDLHETIVIDGVRITALDANHCPGGIMFLFQLPSGTNILHTGDFRASADMEEYPEFWNMDIHCIYLDTTYLSSKYAFKSQWESITVACAEVRSYLDRNIGTEVLIVCGGYLIGKEKVWSELAAQFRRKVWTEPNRRKALEAVADPLHQQWIVDDPKDANIHVLAMKKLSYDELVIYMDQFPDRYDSVLALRPSGWEKNSRPQYRGRINIIGVEYSEHSSFDELKRFVRFLRPKEVISTVPYGNSNQNRTPQVPPSWYQGEVRPERQPLQLSMTSFVTVGSKTPAVKKDCKATKRNTVEDDDDCEIVLEPVQGNTKNSNDTLPKAESDETAHSESGEDDDSDSDWMP